MMRVAMVSGVIVGILCAALAADDTAKKSQKIQGANGSVSMEVPGQWNRKDPSVRIIEHEYIAPSTDANSTAGRLTMMAAGGSVKDNVNRWIGQFDGAGIKKDVKDTQIDGMKVHQIDLRGTYNDRRGPFAPAAKRADYRMLGAIIEMKSGGLYFLKFYGPDATITANEQAFQNMIESVKAK